MSAKRIKLDQELKDDDEGNNADRSPTMTVKGIVITISAFLLMTDIIALLQVSSSFHTHFTQQILDGYLTPKAVINTAIFNNPMVTAMLGVIEHLVLFVDAAMIKDQKWIPNVNGRIKSTIRKLEICFEVTLTETNLNFFSLIEDFSALTDVVIWGWRPSDDDELTRIANDLHAFNPNVEYLAIQHPQHRDDIIDGTTIMIFNAYYLDGQQYDEPDQIPEIGQEWSCVSDLGYLNGIQGYSMLFDTTTQHLHLPVEADFECPYILWRAQEFWSCLEERLLQ